MPIIVQKFGGTSVADSQKILAAARKAIRAQNEGNQVVMVVSAMGRRYRPADRSGQADRRRAARPRNGHAPLDRRAGDRGADGDGHPFAGPQGHQHDRRADRHHHRQHSHQGPHPLHLDRADSQGVGRGEHRHRGRLPGDRRGGQHHHARPRRQRHHGRGLGGGAGGRRLRNLHRRGRRLHDRSPRRSRGPAGQADQLRRNARTGQRRGWRDAQPLDRVRQEVPRAGARAEQFQRLSGHHDRGRDPESPDGGGLRGGDGQKRGPGHGSRRSRPARRRAERSSPRWRPRISPST